jgi:hypothetical protein
VCFGIALGLMVYNRMHDGLAPEEEGRLCPLPIEPHSWPPHPIGSCAIRTGTSVAAYWSQSLRCSRGVRTAPVRDERRDEGRRTG